jgi:peptide/nickel transport system substrate-binding protein
MQEERLRKLIARVKSGTLSRRRFIGIMAGMGIAAPFATQLLLHSGVASAATRTNYKPTKRGGGGPLKLLMWQGPTLLNPHFATGTKDQYGSRIFHEPLADWDGDGNLVAILAAELPSTENGMVLKDGKSVVWKLRKNVQWHDGKPFTADDVVFNAEYAADPATAATTIGVYKDIRVEKIDPYTVRVVFPKPTAYWANPLVGLAGMLIPKHLYEPYKGAKSREAPNNLKPVGTSCYKFVEFTPGDLVRGVINTSYYEPNKPYFDSVEMKGGGDAVSAARAVLQTGEYDYAWNVQVEDEILKRLEESGKGTLVLSPSTNIEHILLNPTDPWTEVAGERASIKSVHPLFSDRAVREAFNLLVDRGAIQEHIYGRTGIASANYLNYPLKYASKNTKWEFNVEKAVQVLDQAGWKTGADGLRAKDGKKLKFVFQTSITAARQKTQAIVKNACQKAGIELELKSIPASVFFSSDVGNPDTFTKFFCDMEMFTDLAAGPDPERFMDCFTTRESASKENKWAGRNRCRFRSDEYDRLHLASQTELDPVKRAAMFIRMNDIVIESRYVIPVVNRPQAAAVSRALHASMTGFGMEIYRIQDWYKEPVS